MEFELTRSNSGLVKVGAMDKPNKILRELGLGDLCTDTFKEYVLVAIHATLCDALERFSKSLEYYIHRFINNTQLKGICPDIVDFGADKVITFNYSNTYERIYGMEQSSNDINHIHGIANTESEETSSIILGTTSQEENLQNYYVEFEKYFQRITKKTGNEYTKWLQQRRSATDKIEVMFFGHSLDPTDSDIIKDLIGCEDSIITICYFKEKNLRQIVANLIEIIGKERLVGCVSGEKPKIKFIKQRNHHDENTGGIEIDGDIRMLYNIHKLSNVKINGLLEKIRTKIKTEDLSYFYSQRKAISFFEALKYQNIDTANKTVFFQICGKLNFETKKDKKLVLFHEREWRCTDAFGDEVRCDTETSELIKEVNEFNAKRFLSMSLSKKYAKILASKSSEDIKKELLEIFEEENPDGEYWSKLKELIRLKCNDEALESALQMLSKESLPLSIRSKFKHFNNTYWEFSRKVVSNEQIVEDDDVEDFL